MKQLAESLRRPDISRRESALHFSAGCGISRPPDPHLTNLKAEIGSRILTGYPSDV
jgi:hypothetical protein